MGLEEGDRCFTEIMVEWAVSARFFFVRSVCSCVNPGANPTVMQAEITQLLPLS